MIVVRDFKKAVVVSRGRTGSSVITDELGQTTYSRSLQEIFTSGSPPGDAYRHFNTWRAQADPPRHLSEEQIADMYLDHLEERVEAEGHKAFFWKALSQHFVERPYMGSLLKRRGYKAICLRRNPANQVISGMVAAARGKYNSREKYEDERTFTLDIDQYKSLVAVEWHMGAADKQLLDSISLPNIVVKYEDFVSDRLAFFGGIFGFLGLPVEDPRRSNYVVMIENTQRTVENYEDVRAAAAELGLPY